MRLRINEAIESYNKRNAELGGKLTKTALAGLLMPEVRIETARQNLSNWISGRKRPSYEHLLQIVEICKVDLDFIFGYGKKYNNKL